MRRRPGEWWWPSTLICVGLFVVTCIPSDAGPVTVARAVLIVLTLTVTVPRLCRESRTR
jgi:hypothetical protein